jgi:hypothetical protein
VTSDDWSDSDDDLDDHDDLDDLRAFGAAGDLDELDRWLAESRVDAAVTSRRKERWLAQQAGEEASVAGVLRDLGERGTTVVVSTVAERRHRGRVRAVGDDFAILDTEQGEVVVRFAAVSAVRVPGDGAVTGDRADRLTVTLADVLPTMAADRPRGAPPRRPTSRLGLPPARQRGGAGAALARAAPAGGPGQSSSLAWWTGSG